MKKKIFALTLALLLSLTFQRVNAQSFGQGTVAVSAGYGFGTLTGALFDLYETQSGFKASALGPIYVKGEIGLSDHIGLGVNFAYASNTASFEYPSGITNYEATMKRTSYSVLGRLNVHFLNSERLDPYWGVGLGFRNASWTYDDNQPNGGYSFGTFKTLVPIGFETTLGLRVYITDNIGAYAEVGAAKSIAQVGLVGKF